MGLVAWIVLGAIAGFLGNYIMRGGFGMVASLILGIISAVIAGYVSNLVRGNPDAFGLDFLGLVMSTFFAIIVVGVAKTALGRGGGA
jgi:uncharacterized membrane protein YeaQ/YmgE (transglycosylase-associated protein family)